MDRIVEKIIPENINGYKYFVYLWEVVETGLKYCGYHKGIPLKDAYYHTSKHKKFNKQFSDNSLTLKYEVLGYYKYEDEAMRFEGLGIRSRKQKGEKMANISNSRNPFWDKIKVNEMYEQIISGTLGFELRPRSEIDTLGWWQTRSEGNQKHKIKIRRRIDDAGGALDKTNPLVIARGSDKVLGLGDEVGISGKHTGEAIDSSKHATQYKRIDIDLSDWNKAEIKKLSSLLNDEEMVKLPQKAADYVKELVELWEDSKVEPDSTEAYDWLEGYKSLSIIERTNIMEKAKIIVDTKKDALSVGKEKKEYHQWDKDTIKIVESYEADGVKVLLMGSGRHSFERIFETMWDKKNQDWLQGIHTIRLLIHHSSLLNKKQWAINKRPYLELVKEKLNLPFEIEYIELPYYISDKKKGK